MLKNDRKAGNPSDQVLTATCVFTRPTKQLDCTGSRSESAASDSPPPFALSLSKGVCKALLVEHRQVLR